MNFGLANEIRRKEWLKASLFKIREGSRILDAGAGELANKAYCDHLIYTSQDFCQYEGLGDQKGLQMGDWDTKKIDIVSDITAIPVESLSFDALLCSEVLEHLPDPVLALKEFSRVLKNQGTLILTAPFASLTHFSPYHFSTGFNKYFYQHHLPAMGFEIQEITSNGNFFEFMAQESHRLEFIAQKFCDHKISYFDRKKINWFVELLKKLNIKENGSDEVLCFGYNVFAKKIE